KVPDAIEAFREGLAVRPSDLASFTFRSAADRERELAREALSKATEKMKPLEVAAISPPNKTVARADKLPKIGAVTMKRLSEERHDHNTSAFLKRVDINDPYAAQPGADVISHFPQQLSELGMGSSQYYPDHTVVHYGPALLMVGDSTGGIRSINMLGPLTDGFRAVLKPAAAPAAPAPLPTASPVSIPPPMVDSSSINVEVRFAKVVGSILVAQLSHEGDGMSVKPDGFLVGFDLANDKLAWVSDAKVSNAYTFYASGAYAVGAFGTTTNEERSRARAAYTKPPAGDSKLVVIELATGKTITTQPLAGRADYVYGKGNRVYAWEEDSIESFEITESPAAPKTELGSLTRFETAAAAIPSGDNTKCWLRNAAVAFDHRDGPALLAIAKVLPDDASLTKGLVAAGEFFVDRAGGRPGLDLTEIEPITFSPIASAKVRTDGPKKTVTTKRFTPIKESELYYPSGRMPDLKPGEKRAEFAQNAYPNGPSHLYPREYGVESIHWVWRSDKTAVMAYGQRYVAIAKDDVASKVIDFAPFGSKVDVKEIAGGYRPLSFVTYLDQSLLLVTNPNSYDPKAPTAYMAMVDLGTGTTLWRTEAGVLPRPPIIFEDYLATVVNRGTSSELVAFRRHDGQAAVRVSFPEPATDFGWDGRGALFITLPKERKYFTFR
ncbi:MAG: hypothetical protein HOV80_13020, partial [Polyangiaceae bacterium]|nr:hypothetical protein [Polyangiaceae bacterium]